MNCLCKNTRTRDIFIRLTHLHYSVQSAQIGVRS